MILWKYWEMGAAITYSTLSSSSLNWAVDQMATTSQTAILIKYSQTYGIVLLTPQFFQKGLGLGSYLEQIGVFIAGKDFALGPGLIAFALHTGSDGALTAPGEMISIAHARRNNCALYLVPSPKTSQ
jgi:hypothetical protein